MINVMPRTNGGLVHTAPEKVGAIHLVNRPRRLRHSPGLRSMVRETQLAVQFLEREAEFIQAREYPPS